MSFSTSDQIGTIAELLARTELSRPVVGRYRRPLFRAVPLGDKYPVTDLIVDVRLADAQVKIELYREVLAFWRTNRPILQRTRFKDV
jgi:hypothetical protein